MKVQKLCLILYLISHSISDITVEKRVLKTNFETPKN